MNQLRTFLRGYQTAVLAVITSLAIFYMFSKTWYKTSQARIKAEDETIQKLKESIASQEASLNELSRRLPAPSGHELEVEVQNVKLLNSNYSTLLKKISNDAAIEGDINIKKLTVDKTENIADLQKVEITLDLEGSFVAVGRFLENFEKSKLLTDVSTISMRRLKGELRRCTAKIKLASYLTRHG